MFRTKKSNWNIISAAPETHKNDLIKNLIEQNQVYDIDVIDKWISKEFFNNFIGIVSLFQSIKLIDDSIVIYADISDKGIKEFTITSKTYTKDIFDKIVNLILDFEDKTDIKLIYYYISEKQMKNPKGLYKL